MISLTERIEAFHWLGQVLGQFQAHDWMGSIENAQLQNPWFDESSILMALGALRKNLKTPLLEQWLAPYDLEEQDPKQIGVIMAGNVPLVGFHDLLCVLITGHQAVVKLSSQDNVLLPQMANIFIKQFPQFKKYICFDHSIGRVDAIIATGSDNSARYFQYHFKDIPKIIRKNRSSIGVLTGEEGIQDISSLGKDIFTYFGLGCRNVSKVFVPTSYDVQELVSSWSDHKKVLQHLKYANNYRYHKSLFSLNGKKYFDGGLLLSIEKEAIVAPVAVLHYEYYEDQQDLAIKLERHQDKIQCIVSGNGWVPGSIPFGQAQYPNLWDYADQVDTLKFLTNLD